MKIKHHPFVRKGIAQCNRIRRFAKRIISSDDDYRKNPPILCNSFPKSGTHLLLQVLESLPGKRHYGSFIATVPSISFRQRSRAAMLRRICAIAPGEIVPAHLYYSHWAEESLALKNCLHYFIYRDPRDVMLSEANYLARMAWWHALHRSFKRKPSESERLRLSLTGMEEQYPDYPNIAKRFSFYEGWVHSSAVCAVRFEDLVGPNRETTIREIVAYYVERSGIEVEIDQVVEQAVRNIQPSKSHTFHRGECGRGARVFSNELRDEFIDVAGDLLKRLGYLSEVNIETTRNPR